MRSGCDALDPPAVATTTGLHFVRKLGIGADVGRATGLPPLRSRLADLGSPAYSHAMTIIGTMRLGDRLIIGADGQLVADGRVTIESEKLHVVQWAEKLIWGYSGAQPVGEAFKKWIGQTPLKSWGEFRTTAAEQLAGLNGLARTQAQLARTQTEPAEILAAGFIGGEAGIVHFDNEGGATDVIDRVSFIGSGMTYALVAWAAIGLAVGEENLLSVANFRAAIEAPAKLIVGLGGPPIRIEELEP